MQSVSRQRLGKRISEYRTVLCNAVTSSTIEAVFSVGYVQSAYKEVNSEASSVQGSYELVVKRSSRQFNS
jgi:hypothetical protein